MLARKLSTIVVALTAGATAALFSGTAAADAAPASTYVATAGGISGRVVDINDNGDLLVFRAADDSGYVVPKGRAPIKLRDSAPSPNRFVSPTSINNSGVSAGYGSEGLPLRWSSTGAPTKLLLPPGSAAGTGDLLINDSGVIVTTVEGPDSSTQIVEWSSPSRPRVLFTTAGRLRVVAINNPGVVAGVLDDRAVLFDVTGRPHALRSPTGFSYAFDLNDNGVTLGTDGTDLVLWDADGRLRTITIGGASGGTFSPAAISNDGTLVGTRTAPGTARGFVRSPSGVISILPPLRGTGYTVATCINEQGVVAGMTGENTTTVWTRAS